VKFLKRIFYFSGNLYLQKLLLQPEAAFEGGKWGDHPRPRSFDKKKSPQAGKNVMNNEKN